jgi:nucleotide-binding universal stress UspA family protein
VRRVVEDQVPGFTGRDWMVTEDLSHADVWEPARQHAQAETEAAAARLGVAPDVSTTIGDPGYQLRALSETVDLVIVGSRRWGPIARLVSGGVGETLAADASCSIMLVPRPARRRARATSRQSTPQPAIA